MSHLHLQTITRGVFGNMGSLLELDLSCNRLKYLEHNILKGTESSLEILRIVGNPLGNVAIYAFRGLNQLQHFYTDSERICLPLSNTVRCHFNVAYNIPCCSMVNARSLFHLLWIANVFSIGMHTLSVVYWCIRKGEISHRVIEGMISCLSCLLACYPFYVITVNEIYGDTYAYYRPLLMKELHCIGTGVFTYLIQYTLLLLRVLTGFNGYEAVAKPFKHQRKPVRSYMLTTIGFLFLLTTLIIVPLAIYGLSLIESGSACLIYPVCHRTKAWQYILAQSVLFDIALYLAITILSLAMVNKIKGSSVGPITPIKRHAITRGKLYCCSQVVSLLISILVQILAVTLKFGDQEMFAVSLIFTLQNSIAPLITFASKSFRKWILSTE